MNHPFYKGTIPLIFGGAAISGEGGGYGFGAMSESEAESLLIDAFDLGVKTFDTAPIYGFTLSEKRLGKFLKRKREEIAFISKSGVTWHDNQRVNMTNDPGVAVKMLHESLVNLQSDYIDLYMVHWPDQRVDIRKTVEALERERERGKIKQIGLCNTSVAELEKASEITKIASIQSEFSLLKRDVATSLFPYLSKNKIPFMSWGTLGKGILTGRVTKDRIFDPLDYRKNRDHFKRAEIEKSVRVFEQIQNFSKRVNYSPLEFALGHNLSHPECQMVIAGPKNRGQLEGLVNALKHLPGRDLVDELLKEIENFHG